MKRPLACLAVLASAWASPLYATPTVLTGNGGFEAAGPDGPTDSDLFDEFFGGAPGTLSERDATNPASGSFSHHVLAIGSDGAGAVAGITQNTNDNLGLSSLEEGTTATVSFEVDLNLGVGGVAFGEFSILNSVGAIVATTGAIGLTDSGPGFELVTLPTLTVPSFGAAPDDEFFAFLNINAAAGAFDGSTSEAFIDNVSVVGTLAVPEPTSFVLLAASGFCLVARRRR